MKKIITIFLFVIFLNGCTYNNTTETPAETKPTVIGVIQTEEKPAEVTVVAGDTSVPSEDSITPTPKEEREYLLTGNAETDSKTVGTDLYAEKYNGKAYTEVNGNIPFFTDTEKALRTPFEEYSDLDYLNRCGTAFALIGKEIMPTEERGEIGMVKPSGWHTVKYERDIISDLYLYNRSHLLAYMLSGENANEKNLITGTRYMNVSGMLPFEEKVKRYMDNNPDGLVLYRVTPEFEGDDLVAQGVLMECYSIDGTLSFCVFCYNIQPYIEIDYKTGDSKLSENKPTPTEEVKEYTYVLNTNSKKIHIPSCSSVTDMKEKNKEFTDKTLEELMEEGYVPCGICHAGQ